MASRVVPGTSCTMARSSPISRLNSVDLPALGRPTSTTEYAAAAAAARPWPGCSGATPSGPSPAGGPERPDPAPAPLRRATTSSSRSPVPRPCSALTWWGVAETEREQLPDRVGLVRVTSTLLATTNTGTSAEYSTLATCSSSEVHSHRGVHHEQHRVGLAHGPLRLGADLGVELVAAGAPAAGVEQREALSLPLGVHRLAVAGDAGVLLHDRLPATEDAVHQRRLADVGTADHGHHRVHGDCSASLSARPWVATTSTSRGRSCVAIPSRKRPRLRHTSGSR